jgi:streptogramin lyase
MNVDDWMVKDSDFPNGDPFPTGIVLDSKENAYITCGQNRDVVKLNPSGEVVARWSVFRMRYSIQRRSIGIDARNRLYAFDTDSRRIFSLDSSGKHPAVWGHFRRDADHSVAVDRSGRVYVLEKRYSLTRFKGKQTCGTPSQILVFNSSGGLICRWDVAGRDGEVLFDPVMAANPDGGAYVLAKMVPTLKAAETALVGYDAHGKLITEFKHGPEQDYSFMDAMPGTVRRKALAVDANGNVYAGVSGKGIWKVNPKSRLCAWIELKPAPYQPR